MLNLIKECSGKKVLVVVAHHDDESLFCGGLLTEISGKCDLTIMCVHQYFKYRNNAEKWNDAFKKIDTVIRAKLVQGDAVPHKADDYFDAYFTVPHNYYKIKDMVQKVVDEINPDVIISHNQVGEYGHVDHVLVSYAVSKLTGSHKSYKFGTGIKKTDTKVIYDKKKKKRLIGLYEQF